MRGRWNTEEGSVGATGNWWYFERVMLWSWTLVGVGSLEASLMLSDWTKASLFKGKF